MKFCLIAIIVSFVSISVVAGPKAPSGSEKNFGNSITTAETQSLSEVINSYDNYKGKTVTFEATAKKVCEQKGCWMVLKDGDHEVRTLFKDYGFFVPKTILGKKVRVQGVMEQKKVSAATIRHFMKDEGKKVEDIQKVKTGQIKFQFVATGVEIL